MVELTGRLPSRETTSSVQLDGKEQYEGSLLRHGSGDHLLRWWVTK